MKPAYLALVLSLAAPAFPQTKTDRLHYRAGWTIDGTARIYLKATDSYSNMYYDFGNDNKLDFFCSSTSKDRPKNCKRMPEATGDLRKSAGEKAAIVLSDATSEEANKLQAEMAEISKMFKRLTQYRQRQR